MRLGWDHCGYDTVSDPDLEGDMVWQPPSKERTERGRLLGPVPLPRVNAGNTRDAPSTEAGAGAGAREGAIAGSSVPCSSASINNINSDALPLLRRHHSEGQHEGERLYRESSLASPVGRNPAVEAFWRGSGAWRARFTSEDSTRVTNGLASSTSSAFVSGAGGAGTRGGGSRRGTSLWRRLRWGPVRSISMDESDRGGGTYGGVGGSDFERIESNGEGTQHRTVREKVHELLHLDFDPDFDTSRQHLVKLFNILDTNGSGTISYEAMRMGLANLGTYSDLNYLMRQADMDKRKEITLDGFVATVQEHAAKMFAAKREVPVTCFCYDYSPGGVSFRWVKTGRRNPPSPAVPLRDLMNEPAGKKGQVRWICLTGSDPSLVIRMASRYGIHPLQVEDCLNPKERLKVDAYRASMKPPACSACKSPQSSASWSDASPSPNKPTTTSYLEGSNHESDCVTELPLEGQRAPAISETRDGSPPVERRMQPASERRNAPPAVTAADSPDRKSLFPQERGNSVRSTEIPEVSATPAGGDPLSPLPLRSTTASDGVVAHAGDDILHVLLGRISLKEPSAGRPSNFQTEQVSIFLVGDHTVLFIERTPSDVSDFISNRMLYAGSKLRLNNARYLVYSLMDSIVDEVFPIMQHFQKWLVELQGKLLSEEMGPSLEVVRAIQQISRDMHMITFYLRPMKIVATQLITDLPGNDMDLKRHLEDLRDHMLILEDQALRMLTWSRSLNKDWVNEQQHRMNQVVYILTMVTSAFMPAQFLTGVFGMNFKFMPELNWRYSYASFWVLVALLAFSSYHVYKRHKWL